ncbi:MAG: LLM class flavin-dependent oxidoreductase, partial [Betaproteobacteria bacterium]
MVRLSVLDLSPIAQGSTAAHSFRNSLSLAQHAEQWGYARYWLAEHHGMPGIASAATAVLLAHIG